MYNGLLPIGSVVLIGGSIKKVMIVGVAQKGMDGKLWDYAGVLFPEGYIDSEKLFLFNSQQVAEIYALGYQDKEQMAFKEKAEAAILELRRKG